MFTTTYGHAGELNAQRAADAYVRIVGGLGNYYLGQANQGRTAQVLPALRVEEANLLHALDLARAEGLWEAAAGCLQGLIVLYDRTGRDSEWARLVAAITPDFTDPATGGPLPGREPQWSIITQYSARLAENARDWPTAATLYNARLAWNRDLAAQALAAPPASLTSIQRTQIRNLCSSLIDVGDVLRKQNDPSCLPPYQEALVLIQKTGDRTSEAQVAGNLGNAYLEVPKLRDLDQAEHWFQHSLNLRPDGDAVGRASSLSTLGAVALQRFNDARAAGEAEAVLLRHLNDALRSYQQSLDLTPADDHRARATREHQIGVIFRRAGDTVQALRHYQRSIQHEEALGNIYGAGQSRYNIGILLADDGRISDALQYLRAALDNYRQAGPGAADEAARVEQFITDLEQDRR